MLSKALLCGRPEGQLPEAPAGILGHVLPPVGEEVGLVRLHNDHVK